MGVVEQMTGVAAAVAVAGSVCFLVRYLRIPWWRSRDAAVRETGWHVVTFTAAVGGLAALRVVTIVLGDGWPGQEWMRLAMISVAAAAAWWRLAMVRRLQREQRLIRNGGNK